MSTPAPVSSVEEEREKERQRRAAKAGAEAGNRAAMVFFDGATALIGVDKAEDPYLRPVHEVKLAPFSLDEREVTVEEYGACVELGACPALPREVKCEANTEKKGAMNCVDFERAKAFCAWRGHRLPTEAEWEYAATGARKGAPGAAAPKPRIYPWGVEEPDETRACFNRCGAATRQPCAVGSRPAGNTKEGLEDMAGNAAEWVDAPYCLYTDPDCKDPQGKTMVVRGGAWCGSDSSALRGTARGSQLATLSSPQIGFRCAKSGQR